MNAILRALMDPFRRRNADKQAKDELELSRIELLQAHTTREYHMAQYRAAEVRITILQERIKRLGAHGG